MKPTLLFLLALLFVSTILAAPTGPPPVQPDFEYVIISAGVTLMIWEKWKDPPHDRWWQNFIQAGQIRIRELKAQGVPAHQITWMIFSPSYETRGREDKQNYLGEITARAHSEGVKLIYFRDAQAIINHLNAGKPRDRVKIADLEYFGHSNKACLMLDYSNTIDSASKAWLHEDTFPQQLNPGIFAKGAFVKSWGCFTGESMSQKFRRVTRVPMWGVTGRTQYLTHELPVPSNGKWKY